MDETRFDALTRTLSGHPTRRAALRLLAGGLLGGLLSRQTAVPALAAQRPDRDGDGLYDGDEVRVYGTDPDVFDSDCDGVGDGEEVYLGTDPRDGDCGAPPAPAGGVGQGTTLIEDSDPLLRPALSCAAQGLGTDCGGYCTDTLSDPNNCGGCGNFCSLVEGLSCCSGVCISTTSDAFNCGGCGNSCPPGQTCLSGFCTSTSTGFICPDGLIDCGVGYCVDISSDMNNCGACGNWCRQGSVIFDGIASCENYQCV